MPQVECVWVSFITELHTAELSHFATELREISFCCGFLSAVYDKVSLKVLTELHTKLVIYDIACEGLY